MKTHITAFVLVTVLLLSANGTSHAHQEGATAYAIPLNGITIDGKLDDWPEKMVIYPITCVFKEGSGYKTTPPDGPEDLSASFRVGYNAENGVLYVAVVAQDDDLVVYHENPQYPRQDACEVYIDGDHSGGDNAWRVTGAQQYLMVPGPGMFGLGIQNNPAILMGDIVLAGIQAASLRAANITTYEWAIPLFERYPDRRLRIETDKTIGFDISMIDADGEETGNWIAWTPEGGKVYNSDLFGDLVFVQDYDGLDVALKPVAPSVLLESYDDLGFITGTVTLEKQPYPGLVIEAYRGNQPVKSVHTDAEGRYHVTLQSGEYSLRVRGGQGMEQSRVKGLAVSAGQETITDFSVTPIKMPEVLKRSAEVFKSLRGYQDSIIVESHTIRPGEDELSTWSVLLAFERPNKLRLENKQYRGSSLLSDGTVLVEYMKYWQRYTQKIAPDFLTSTDLRIAGQVGMIIQNIIVSDDPLRELMKGLEEVKEVGRENLDGSPVTVIEMTKLPGSLPFLKLMRVTRHNISIKVRLWIGNQDFLIRKVYYEIDFDRLSEGMSGNRRRWMKEMKMIITLRHKAIGIDPAFPDKTFVFIPPEGVKLVE